MTASALSVGMLASTVAAAESPEAVALRVVSQLGERRFGDVAGAFTPELSRGLTVDRLARTWTELIAAVGPVGKTSEPRVVRSAGTTAVTIPVAFEKATFDIIVSVTPEGRLAGLLIKPAETPAGPWTPAAYSDPSAYREIEITVGASPALPGFLTRPRSTGKAPAVVLVHGSGPQDRNLAIGPNRPFQDMAEGLASRGIAVLRYDKRTRVDPGAFAAKPTFTVIDETIADALAAVALLKVRPDIDPHRIVVLGHSLGGTLAPRIAGMDGSIAAIVVMAGAARPIPDLIVEQTEYLSRVMGPADAAAQARIAALKAEAVRARAAKIGDAGPAIMNAPPSYWADLNAYDPAASASRLDIPILVLQGGRDYQVTQKDFDLFRSALVGRPNATLRMLDRLNHLFMAGQGPSTPAEYRQPGHVDEQAIQAVAEFVRSLPDRHPR